MLLIEKTVKLLDDFHYEIFYAYVKNISKRSYYPLVLIELISRDFEHERSSAYFCKNVYSIEGEVTEKDKKKFFQLAHYTFKLIGHLSKNYPDFLQHNLTSIQHLVNTGQLTKALTRAHALKDVAERIEDFDAEIKVVEFLMHAQFKREEHTEVPALYSRLEDLLQYRSDRVALFKHYYTHFRSEKKVKLQEGQEGLIAYFKPFHASKSIEISLLSRYFSIFGLYFFRMPSFHSDEVFAELQSLEAELENNNHIVFAYLFNVSHIIKFLKLHILLRKGESEQVMEEANLMTDQTQSILYWNSFLNLPEIFSLAIQLNYYSTNYNKSYQLDASAALSVDVSKELEKLKVACQDLLAIKDLKEQYTLRYINIETIYCGFLILGTNEEIKEAIGRLEGVLFEYQQSPFHAYIDSIYVVLISGAHAIQDFAKVEHFHKRYKKSTTGKAVHQENNLLMNGLYLLSKWRLTQKGQYAKKLNKLLVANEKGMWSKSQLLLKEMSNYFELDV